MSSGPDAIHRVVPYLQDPEWRITSPASGGYNDGRWHATSRDIDLSASTLDALLDQLDWFLAS
jgi:hypothetical protein